jgi:hypothetical protein
MGDLVSDFLLLFIVLVVVIGGGWFVYDANRPKEDE